MTRKSNNKRDREENSHIIHDYTSSKTFGYTRQI